MEPAREQDGPLLPGFGESIFDDALRSPLMSPRRFSPTLVIGLLSLIVTLLAAWVTYQSNTSARTDRFRLQSMRIADEISGVMTAYQQVLRAGVALFDAGGTVGADNWHRFVAALDLDRTHPGTLAMGFIEAMRRAHPNDTVRPEAPLDVQTSVVLIEPRTPFNSRSLGVDMFAEPPRRAAMEAARDTGLARATRSVTLLQDSGSPAPQRGVLVFQAVYRHGADLNDVPSRRAALRGYVFTAFRMQSLFDKAVRGQVSPLLETIAVRLYDSATPSGDGLLFTSDADPPGAHAGPVSGLHQNLALEFAGQSWQLAFAELPGFANPADRWTVLLVLAAGGLASLLSAALARAMARARMRAVTAQRILEVEVASRKEAQRSLEQANSEVRIANQELVHRVKNVMAVVSSIAAQTARYTPAPAEFNEMFRERLAALGRVHDLLKPNPAYRPDVAVLVPAILAPYLNLDRKALHLSGPSFEISQSSAVMLSLVINELAANSVRYGAWTSTTGAVHLNWQIVAATSGQPDQLAFHWAESGGPQVAEPPKRGFGSNVLKYAIEQGLRGRFEIHYEPTGIRCDWSIPRPRPSADAAAREY